MPGDADEDSREAPYLTIGLPRVLVREAERLIRAHPELGFRNRSELAVEGFRELLAELNRRVYYAEAAKAAHPPAEPVESLLGTGVPLRSRGGGFKHRRTRQHQE